MKSKFRNKLFLAYASLTTLIVIIFTVIMLNFVMRTNRNLEIFHQQEMLNSNVKELNALFHSMDTLAAQAAVNMELMNFFIPLDNDNNPDNYFLSNLLDSIRAASILATINSTSNSALRISIFNTHGDYISSGRLYETPEKIASSLQENALEAYMVQNEAHLFGPHTDFWSDNTNIRLFTLLRPLATSLTSKNYGYIAVQNNVTTLNEFKLWDEADGVQHILLNGDLSPVLAGNNGIARILQENTLPENNTFSYMRNDIGEKVIVFASKLDLSDWTLYRILPAGQLNIPYRLVYHQLVLYACGLLAILLFIVYILADHISIPLRNFSSTIENINLDNLTQTDSFINGAASEELQTLDRTFRSVLQRLNQSIDFEMKAYLRALQSQMNPHFLYNMLSAIIESADEDNSPRTVAMCEKLSLMLRYIADYSNDYVSLQNEIDYMRYYLDLMKERYADYFNYEIYECEGLKDLRVPRITLQPLTENCFKHGFKSSRPPYFIEVTFARNGDAWSVQVRDNGGGIIQPEIDRIYHRINDSLDDLPGNYSELRLNGMGLTNTVLRLKLMQRGNIDFDISNAQGGGTIVTIGGRL